MTESRVVCVRMQRKVGLLPPAPSISELSVSSMRSTSSGDALTGTRRKSAAAIQASVACERNPGVSMMIGRPEAARFCAVFHASAVASSTTGTPPSARSRRASRVMDRWGSASMIVGARPVRCQCTARQLASVLLPLPPFIVATVIICLMADLPFPLTRYGRITRSQCYRILGRHSPDDADRAVRLRVERQIDNIARGNGLLFSIDVDGDVFVRRRADQPNGQTPSGNDHRLVRLDVVGVFRRNDLV